jgi:hypothetical protein
MKWFMRQARPFVKLLMLCYCVSDFFRVKTSIEVQLGDNYIYKISSILRGSLGEKNYHLYIKKLN